MTLARHRRAVRVDIAVKAGTWPPRPVLAKIARQAVRAVAESARRAGCPALPANGAGGEVSVVFTDDEAIRFLNSRWRNIGKATNVLAFAQDSAGKQAGILGDIVLAHETVAREAALEGKCLDDHIAHMIVHGFLHLLGYDHQNDEDARLMEDMERKALALMGIADPYSRSATTDE